MNTLTQSPAQERSRDARILEFRCDCCSSKFGVRLRELLRDGRGRLFAICGRCGCVSISIPRRCFGPEVRQR